MYNYFNVKFKTQAKTLSQRNLKGSDSLTGEFDLLFKKKTIPILHKYF